jgi:hypothetical protein
MNTNLMLFQAQDKMRFRLVGGSLIQPAANGENLYSAAPPSTCQSILNSYYHSGSSIPLTAHLFAACAAEMLTWKVGTVLWTRLGAQPDAAETFFTALLGPPTIGATDSALWLHPEAALRLVVADGGRAAAARAVTPRRVAIPDLSLRRGCAVTASLVMSKPVSAFADWVNVTCRLTEPKLTVELLRNGKLLASATVPVPNGASFKLSVTGECRVGDTYQASATLAAPQGPMTNKSRAVTAKSC